MQAEVGFWRSLSEWIQNWTKHNHMTKIAGNNILVWTAPVLSIWKPQFGMMSCMQYLKVWEIMSGTGCPLQPPPIMHCSFLSLNSCFCLGQAFVMLPPLNVMREFCIYMRSILFGVQLKKANQPMDINWGKMWRDMESILKISKKKKISGRYRFEWKIIIIKRKHSIHIKSSKVFIPPFAPLEKIESKEKVGWVKIFIINWSQDWCRHEFRLESKLLPDS